MKPRLALRILAVLMAGTLVTSTAYAGYAADKFKQTLNHKYCTIDTSTFDGTSFKVPYPKAKQYYDNFVSQLNQAVSQYNRMSSRDRSGVRGMVPEMNKKIKWAKAMKPKLNALSVTYANEQNAAAKAARDAKAAKQAAKDAKRTACNFFYDNVYKTYKDAWHLHELHRQMETGKQYVETLERYNHYKAAAEHLDKGCSHPELKDLLASGEACWRKGDAHEPRGLCKIPPQKDKLLRLFVDNQGKRQMQNILNLWNLKRFQKSLGPPFSFGHTYEYVTTVTDKDKREVLKRIEPLYKGLNVALPDLSDTWKQLAAKKQKIKALIDEQAKKPHGVKKKKMGYWKKSIAKQIKAKYGSGAKILRGQNGKWEVTLRINAPTDRKQYGYVLWKAPGSPYCHASMYRVVEKYAGNGKYSKAGGATMMGMSFHRCK